jgi:hypothetical protein
MAQKGKHAIIGKLWNYHMKDNDKKNDANRENKKALVLGKIWG